MVRNFGVEKIGLDMIGERTKPWEAESSSPARVRRVRVQGK
jgi:hypothetical protein